MSGHFIPSGLPVFISTEESARMTACTPLRGRDLCGFRPSTARGIEGLGLMTPNARVLQSPAGWLWTIAIIRMTAKLAAMSDYSIFP